MTTASTQVIAPAAGGCDRFRAEGSEWAALASLSDDEILALCSDADPTRTLINYLLITSRDEAGRVRLKPLGRMSRQAQELFAARFNAQKLADMAGDPGEPDQVRQAAAAVLDCCTMGGWQVRMDARTVQLGQVGAMIVQDQLQRGQRDQAARSMSLFTRNDAQWCAGCLDAIAG